MPIYFTWLIDGRLGASTYPTDEEDLAELQERGIGLLVNLHERAHPSAALGRVGIRQVHLPVVDMAAPSLDVIERAVDEIQRALDADTNVVVHCAAGLGRTGTILACVLVKLGASASDAIARVREARPGSVETTEQVYRVIEYASLLGR